MDTYTATPNAGWYQLQSDPQGALRYHDGQQWTDHVSEPQIPTGTDPSISSGPKNSSHRVSIGLIATAAVLVVAIIGLALQQHGRPNLAAGDAAHALLSPAQVSAATGVSFGPAQRDVVSSESAGSSSDALDLGPCAADGPAPIGQSSQSLTAATSGGGLGPDHAVVVAEQVLVYASPDQADEAVDQARNAFEDPACASYVVTEIMDSSATVTIDDQLYIVTGNEGEVDVAFGSTGNAVVMVMMASRGVKTAPVTPDEMRTLLGDAVDAAGNPDPTRV